MKKDESLGLTVLVAADTLGNGSDLIYIQPIEYRWYDVISQLNGFRYDYHVP